MFYFSSGTGKTKYAEYFVDWMFCKMKQAAIVPISEEVRAYSDDLPYPKDNPH